MSYRIIYGRERRKFNAVPVLLGVAAGTVLCFAAGEWSYEEFARFVGEMIRNAR